MHVEYKINIKSFNKEYKSINTKLKLFKHRIYGPLKDEISWEGNFSAKSVRFKTDNIVSVTSRVKRRKGRKCEPFLAEILHKQIFSIQQNV